MKKFQTKMLAIVLAATITFSSTGMEVLAAEGGALETEIAEALEGTAATEGETVSTEETEVSGMEESTEEEESVLPEETETSETEDSIVGEETFSKGDSAVYKGENFRVIFRLAGKWDGGYNANISIENTGETAIENWYLGFESENDISNIWNAKVYSCDGEKYIIKNDGWNKKIAAGSSVEFGIGGQQEFAGFPKAYQLIGESTNVKTEDYSVEYRVDNDWGNGFTGTILITNHTEETMEDWVLEFDFDNDFSDIWNGEMISHEGAHYVIRNAGYNRDIDAHENVSIGFTVNDGCAENLFSNSRLYQFSSELKAEEDNKDNQDKNNQDKDDKEPLEDIGEAYYKEPSEEDVIVNEETGIMYVRNQVLVSAYPGLSKSTVEAIASDIDADIVGYIELTNDYQLEFRENKSADELDIMINYIRSFSFISYASLNVVEERKDELTKTNDKLYIDNEEDDDWDEDVPDGDNWGLEALHVLTAWDNKADFLPVKVGIYDSAFSKHEDLLYEHIFNNPLTDNEGHGTHVAGILAAQHNNEIGISGVATNVKLYAYSRQGSKYVSIMGDKHAYATLIGNHVKVINVSFGNANIEEQFAASRGNTKAINSIQLRANILEEYLNKLVMAGYDFLIVTSAGNAEDNKFVEDSSSRYGYREYDSEKDNKDDVFSGKMLALYDCALNAIKDSGMKQRILVVGAVGHSITDGTVTYQYAPFSNVGDRVDVCAPGVNILSTVPINIDPSGYVFWDGTSMACPYISGIAALMYQVNPALKATTVARYLRASGSVTVKDVHENTYRMPNASVCCAMAKHAGEEENNDRFLPSGILTGIVYSVNGSLMPKVDIVAVRKSTSESNLEDYCFRTGTDMQSDFVLSLPQGTYDVIVSGSPYLPYCIKNVVIEPDETKYIEIGLMHDDQYNLNQETKAYGTVIDALSGKAIENAVVKLRTGWDNTNGSYVVDKTGAVCSTKTDSSGKFAVPVPRGQYTAEITKDGYVTGYFNVIALGNEAVSETIMVLTTELPNDEYRIILTWGQTPGDLDSHLTYYVDDVQQYHVFFSNKTATYNGKKVATLDLDDANGYGPETVTLTLKADDFGKGVFRYSVHNFAGRYSFTSKSLSLSGAMVRVYTGNEKAETFYVPQNNAGTVWHVFDIDKNGITPVNQFYSSNAQGVR